jgi:4-aminobutyrate aminotransferase
VEDVDGNIISIAARALPWPPRAIRIEVVRAIAEQASRFLPLTDYCSHGYRSSLAKLPQIAPVGARARTFFSNSGTEAVEAAIKLARYHTGRVNLIAFLGSFHGRTLGALSLTSSRNVQRRGFGPMMPGVFHAPYANPYRYAGKGGTDHEGCARDPLAYIEDQILNCLVSPDEVAAITWSNPFRARVRPSPVEFIQGWRKSPRSGMLLVADEVQSGIGRTGKCLPSNIAACSLTSSLPRRDRVRPAHGRHDCP